MEIGVSRDDFFVVRQIAASVGEDGIEIVDGVEVGVGERFIDERPQVLGGLELRAVGCKIARNFGSDSILMMEEAPRQ
jgi:hypothetical protein